MLNLDVLDITEKNKILNEYIEYLAIERKKIHDRYKFAIPIYILDEIIESYNKHREDNINVLINLARMNGRITMEQASALKEEFVFHNI